MLSLKNDQFKRYKTGGPFGSGDMFGNDRKERIGHWGHGQHTQNMGLGETGRIKHTQRGQGFFGPGLFGEIEGTIIKNNRNRKRKSDKNEISNSKMLL